MAIVIDKIQGVMLHSHDIGDLNDVAISSIANGQILKYNSTTGKFENGSASGGGDVIGPSSAVDENITIFDSTTGKLIKDSGINISAIIANTAKVTESTAVGDTDSIDLTLSTYTITADVKADGINDTHIDWGTGANQVSALDLPIADSTDYFVGTEVETALSEIGRENAYADSPGLMTGGEITEGTNAGTFKVGALTALFRTSDSVTAPLKYATLAEQDNQAITLADTTYFVSLNYNGGSPTITLSETSPYDSDKRSIPIGKVMKNGGGEVHYISGGFNFQDGVRKLHVRAKELRSVELERGSTIAYSGTNNFTMEAGVAYAGINRITLDAYNSAVTQFTPVYQDGSDGWTYGADRNTIDYEHYDDGDGTLGNVGVARYGTFWVYKHSYDQHVYVLYGRGSYTLAEAEVVQEPTKPAHLTDFGCLIGKIIVPQAGGSFTDVQMVTEQFFTGTAVSDHGNLTGLTDVADHPGYLTLDGNRAMTGNLNMGGNLIEDSNDNELLDFGETADAINFFKMVNSATGNAIDLQAQGDDTDINIALTPKGAGRVTGVYRIIEYRILDKDTDVEADTGVGGEFRVPFGMTVKSVGAYVDTAGVTGVMTIDINEAGTSILSTKITIDTGEKSSETAETPPVISDASIAADAILTFDIDGVQTTKAKGLTIWLDVVL